MLIAKELQKNIHKKNTFLNRTHVRHFFEKNENA